MEASNKSTHEADSIHRAMVIIAGIEMENPEDPPRLWTALEDAYDELSDALGTDGDTTADEEEAKATGRHFVVRSSGDRAKLRAALVEAREVIKAMGGYWARVTLLPIDAALAAPARNCDRFTDELDAQLAFLNEVWLISIDRETMTEQDAYENWTDEMRARYGRWLLASATEQKGNQL